MPRRPLVSIIVVNWNGGRVFADCVNSLSKLVYPNWELLVVDNGSTDGSLENLDGFKAQSLGGVVRLKIIRNRKNLGFAQANNQGWKSAGGKYILLLNNDTKVEPALLDKLVGRLEQDPVIGVVQPKILVMDKPAYLDSVGSFLTTTGFLQHLGFLERDSERYNRERYLFSAKGACVLIKREVIEKVGLFDASYVSYLEETDFCWRVWLAGYKILYFPEAQILHKVGFTSKRQNQVLVNYHAFKNRIATLIKNLNMPNLFFIGGIHLLILLVLGFYYLARLRPRRSFMICRAVAWNVVNIRSLLKRRKKVQQLIRQKSDWEVFKYILKPIDWSSMFVHFIRSDKMLSGVHEV